MIYGIVFCVLAAVQAPWQNPANWQKLSKTMTETQVRQTLGNPIRIKSLDAGQVWYYSDAALVKLKYRVQNGKRTLYYSDSAPPDLQPLNSPPFQGGVPAGGGGVIPPPIAIQPQIQKSPVISQPVSRVGSARAESQSPQSPKTATPESFASRYFIWCGGGIIALAAIIAISQGAKFFT